MYFKHGSYDNFTSHIHTNTYTHRFISLSPFSPRSYVPLGFRTHENTAARDLSDKAIADVVEALLGSYYLYCNGDLLMCWDNIIMQLGVVEHGECTHGFDLSTLAVHRKTFPELDAKEQALVLAAQTIIGYEFNQPQLLLEALTHSSFEDSEIGCYQRLEFLGDAILDLTVIEYLYKHDETLTPGDISV